MSNGDDLKPPGEQPESLQQPEANPDPASGAQEYVHIENTDSGGIVGQAIKVITNPVGFYRTMSKSGGYMEPLLFLVVLSVTAGVVSSVLSLFGTGYRGMLGGGVMSFLFVPIFAVVFGFIGAGILHVIWKIMGSRRDFETSYRCVAYSAAISPVMAVLNLIPGLGTFVSSLWPMALMAVASIYVHDRGKKASWSVFGALAAFSLVINMAVEEASQDMADDLERMQEMMEQQDQ